MLVFHPVDSAEEMQAIHRLRYQVYCVEKHYLQACCYPASEETDCFDEHSVHFAAYDYNDESRLLGCCRLILQNPHGFPFEKAFVFVQPIAYPIQCAELSRLIVAPEARAIHHHILMGLTKQIYLHYQANQLSHCYAIVEKPLLRLLTKLGLPFAELDGPVWFYNTESILAFTTLADVDRQLPRNNRWYYEYLKAPVNEQQCWF